MGPETNAVRDRRAKDVMTRDVLAVQPEWPIEQLADFLVRHRIHGAPVTSPGGELLGVVSLTDIARASTLSEEDLSSRSRHDFYSRLLDEPSGPVSLALPPSGASSPAKVEEIMTPVDLDVDEEAPVREVAARMIDARVHRIFVTREGRMVGIISALDLLRVIRDL